MKAKLTSLLMALALGAFAAGCGDDNEDSGSGTGATAPPATTESAPPPGTTETGGGEELQISADPGGALKFDTDTLEAKAGKVTITMDNPSPVPHAVSIEGGGIDENGETVEQGGKSTVSADLRPGEYEFYCPVGGHEAAGMKGTLTVK